MNARLIPTLLSAAFVLLAPQAIAENLTPELTSGEATALPRIIDTLCIDLVEALNGCETVYLLVSETEPDAADLIVISDRRAQSPQQVLTVARAIAFNGPMFGQSPSLERADNGSLHLLAEQIGIGRSPWTQTLTIAHRNGHLIVAGLTYSTYDRAAGGGFDCDVNLLTGEWAVSAERPDPESGVTVYEAEERGRIATQRVAVSDWSQAMDLPQPCRDGLSQWWAAEVQ